MEYYMPTRILTEKDCVRNHPEIYEVFGTRAFIVTGKHSSRQNGALDDVEGALKEAGISYWIFDEVEENPSIETVMWARGIGVKKGVDFVIGIGGGSPLDAAKAIAMMIANPKLGAEALYDKCELKHLPVIAVPTTAGTGSEVTPWSILTIHEKRTKQSIPHKIFPAVALMDASYLKTMPRKALVSTAVDTLAHLVESYLVTKANDYTRIFSKKGLEFWSEIKTPLLSGKMEDADYEKMMHACTMGGIAITHTGTGLPHALSYMLTYETGLAHGLACGVSLGGYLHFYESKQRMDEVLEALGFVDSLSFCNYLSSLMGEIEISPELWSSDVQSVFRNVGKRMTHPYDITKEQMVKYIASELCTRSE